MKQRDELILGRIASEIDFVSDSLSGVDLEAFVADEVLKRAIGMSTINIGELAGHLSADFIDNCPNSDLVMAVRTRNVYAHGYFTLDFKDVYDTACNDLPRLGEWVKAFLDEEAKR